MLKGKRLTLRAINRDDLPNYVTWLNDPEVNAHIISFMPINLDDETEWYDRYRQNSSHLNLAIIITESQQHIGSVGLMKINHRNQSAELGIMIGEKSCWGQGYGQEAIQLMVQFGFLDLNLHRIQLRVEADHPAAIQCYRNCGFKEEGRLREAWYRHGRFNDHFIMSILRSEYPIDEK